MSSGNNRHGFSNNIADQRAPAGADAGGTTTEFGEVAERSIAAGCKPAAFGLRRFEPSPPHQPFPARVRRAKRLPRALDARRRLVRRGLPSSVSFAATLRVAAAALRAGEWKWRVGRRKSGGLAPPKREVASGERVIGLARRSGGERSERREGGSNSVVESQPSKLLVAGSIPVSRSILRSRMHAKDAHHSSRSERRWASNDRELRMAGQTPLRMTG